MLDSVCVDCSEHVVSWSVKSNNKPEDGISNVSRIGLAIAVSHSDAPAQSEDVQLDSMVSGIQWAYGTLINFAHMKPIIANS